MSAHDSNRPATRAADLSDWFAREVQVHEPALRAYLGSRFPSLPDFDDVVQESFLRIVQARALRPITAVRAFLYATARNLAMDHYRRRQIAAIDGVDDVGDLPVHDEAVTVPEMVGRHQELELLAQAIQTLPDRCRQVLVLRKLHGLNQKEIAARLGISEHTVEAQVGLGMRRCTAFFARHGLP